MKKKELIERIDELEYRINMLEYKINKIENEPMLFGTYYHPRYYESTGTYPLYYAIAEPKNTSYVYKVAQ